MTDYIPANIAAIESHHGDNLGPVHHHISCAAWVPEMEGQGKPRQYNRRQFFLLLMHSDFMRWGLPLPFAGRLVGRIAEALLFASTAGELVIEFHVNGASFFYGVERGDVTFPREEAAVAAGAARFRITLDLAAYWEAVETAFAAHSRQAEAA